MRSPVSDKHSRGFALRRSAFALEDGVVFHTYSAYARGGDVLTGAYQLLDRAPRGRNEDDCHGRWRG
jgi:predicted dithiol-disulfide oxidoreductase (DUF899 family)